MDSLWIHWSRCNTLNVFRYLLDSQFLRSFQYGLPHTGVELDQAVIYCEDASWDFAFMPLCACQQKWDEIVQKKPCSFLTEDDLSDIVGVQIYWLCHGRSEEVFHLKILNCVRITKFRSNYFFKLIKKTFTLPKLHNIFTQSFFVLPVFYSLLIKMLFNISKNIFNQTLARFNNALLSKCNLIHRSLEYCNFAISQCLRCRCGFLYTFMYYRAMYYIAIKESRINAKSWHRPIWQNDKMK